MAKQITNPPERRARAGVELRAVTETEKTDGYIGALVGTIPYGTDSAELRDRRLNNGRPFVEQIAPDAFKRSLAEDGDIMAFAGHTDAPLEAFARIGQNMTVEADANALTWRALIPDTQAGRDLRTLAEKKIISGASFEFNARGAAGERWEKRGTQDVRVITDARLYAVNPVAWPAYADSSLTVDMRSLRAEASESVEVRTYSIEEIAAAFRIPASLIDATSTADAEARAVAADLAAKNLAELQTTEDARLRRLRSLHLGQS